MILVASLIIGGSSVVGLPTTFAVQLAALPLLALIASRSRWYDASVLALVAATLLLFVLHLLPLGGLLGSYVGEAMSISGDWIRTLDALLFFLAAAAFFLVVGTLGENGLNRLVAFLLIGLVLNVALALVQFAASSPVLVGFLPYSTSAGFFANQNHFASLVFVGIPFVIYQFVALRRPLLSLVAVAVLVAAGFATRSVAGAFLSIGAAVVSYAVVANLRPAFRVLLLASVAIGAAVLVFNPDNVLELNPDNPLDRTAIWQTTAQGALAHLPMGSGLGTFEIAYPAFEAEQQITTSFANHAHNEYLELALEGGLPAMLLLLAYLSLLGWNLVRGRDIAAATRCVLRDRLPARPFAGGLSASHHRPGAGLCAAQWHRLVAGVAGAAPLHPLRGHRSV